MKIGFTNGCFDILHAEHVKLLEFARRHCDHLVVGLNSDASVRRLKGDGRPFNCEADRMHILSALWCVDEVHTFDSTSPLALIQRIRPTFLIKGGDYAAKDIVGADFVRSLGGAVLIFPYVRDLSTTRLLRQMEACA